MDKATLQGYTHSWPITRPFIVTFFYSDLRYRIGLLVRLVSSPSLCMFTCGNGSLHCAGNKKWTSLECCESSEPSIRDLFKASHQKRKKVVCPHQVCFHYPLGPLTTSMGLFGFCLFVKNPPPLPFSLSHVGFNRISCLLKVSLNIMDLDSMVDNALAESLVHVDTVLAQFSGLPTLKTIQNKARVKQHQLYTLIEKYKECKSWHVQSNKVRNLIEELIDFCNSKTIEEGDERTQGLCGGAHCTPDVGGCKPNVNVKFMFIICHQNNALHSMHFMLSALPCPVCPALPCPALHCSMNACCS